MLFLLGVALWIAGNEMPSWFGPVAIPLAGGLIALAAITSVTFLHFAVSFAGLSVPSAAIRACYGIGMAATLVAMLDPPGSFGPWGGFDAFFRPNALGWVLGFIWALFGLLGHLVLGWRWFGQDKMRRRQIGAVCLASGLGLLSMSGYAFAAWGITLYPFPLLLLPLYPLILVYGILRYQLMVANAWARRALAFSLLAGCGVATVAAFAMLPLPFGVSTAAWAPRAAIVFVAMVLVDPLRRLAAYIVYPGCRITDAMLAEWRRSLAGRTGYDDLAQGAEQLLSLRLRTAITVMVAPDLPPCEAPVPSLLCVKTDGRWHSALSGWQGAPPGPQYVAHTFGAVLAEAAAGLEHAQTLAEHERAAQQNARLAELGALAATVAHDIRNPLNIIAMAAAGAPAAMRQDIAAQVQRIARLAQDLLDYAKPWRFDLCPLDLATEARRAAASYSGITFAPGLSAPLPILGDPQRLRQVLINLLDNASAAYPEGSVPPAIGIEAERLADGAVLLHICDHGQGVPEGIHDSLFKPFVSRSPNGTGLGLAIVAKIMQAHGGSAALSERPGWKTCFTLSFPPAVPS